MSRRTRLLLPLLALPLAVSACGTTVPGGALAGSSAGDGLSAPVLGGDGATSAPVVGGGTTGSVVTPTTPGGTTGGTAGGTTGGTAPARPTTAGGPVDRTPVKVGVLYLDGADKVASGLGIGGLTTGDAWAQAKAIAAYLNSKGGLGGRPIELHEGRMDAGRNVSDAEGNYAAACAQLTEDAKVSYVISYLNLTTARLACYAQRGVTVIDDQAAVADSAGARYAATFGGPGELAPGRMAEEMVDALWRRGWLTSKSKVGTFVFDTPDGIEFETKHLVPALARKGLKPAASARTGMGADAANQNATVLQFRSAGVDRVLPIGASPLFLMNSAESQGYRPAYAVNSAIGPGALLEGTAPDNQLENAAGIGWSKFLDIGAGKRPGPVSANETICFTIMKNARLGSTSATTQAFQAALCNVLMFLKAAADRYGVVPGLLDKVRASGLPFAPADAYAIRMRPGRADGVAAYRDLAYDKSCECFQYVSGNRPTR